MRALAVVWVLCLNHIRRGAVFADAAIAGLLVSLFLDPTKGPYDWQYLVVFYGLTACALPVINAILVNSAAANIRGEAFFLRSGRPAYYAGVILTSLFMSLLWMFVLIAGLVPFLRVTDLPAGWMWLLGTTVTLNVLLVVAAMTLFSALCGRPREAVAGSALILLGLNTSWFREQASQWIRPLEILTPPLYLNIQSTMAAAQPGLLRNVIYLTVLLGLGLLRFWYREFVRE